MPSPILVIIYNRPDKVKMLVDRINALDPTDIYVCADGPKNGGGKVKCELARDEIECIDPKHRVFKKYSDKNLGCGINCTQGISWFFDNVDSGIIIEDDIQFNRGFIEFCTRQLENHRNNKEIFMISGSPYTNLEKGSNNFLSDYPNIWGWATWKKSWAMYEIAMSNISGGEFSIFLSIYKRFNSFKTALFWFLVIRLCKRKKIDAWDHQLYFYMWKSNAFALTPAKPLTRNVGFDNEANCMSRPPDKLAFADLSNESSTLTHSYIFESVYSPLVFEYEKSCTDNIYKITCINILKLFVKNLFWKSKGWK